MSAKKCPPTEEQLIMEEIYPIITKLDEYIFDLFYDMDNRERVENLHLDKYTDIITLWDIYRHKRTVQRRRNWNVYIARQVLLNYEYDIDIMDEETDMTLQEARDIIVREYLGLMIKKTLRKK